jgi:hypothetical protein
VVDELARWLEVVLATEELADVELVLDEAFDDVVAPLELTTAPAGPGPVPFEPP